VETALRARGCPSALPVLIFAAIHITAGAAEITRERASARSSVLNFSYIETLWGARSAHCKLRMRARTRLCRSARDVITRDCSDIEQTVIRNLADFARRAISSFFRDIRVGYIKDRL